MLRHQELQYALLAWVSETLRADVHRDLGGLARDRQLYWLPFRLTLTSFCPCMLSVLFTLIYSGFLSCFLCGHAFFCLLPGLPLFWCYRDGCACCLSLYPCVLLITGSRSGVQAPIPVTTSQGPTCSVIRLPNGTFTDFVSISTVFLVHLFIRFSIWSYWLKTFKNNFWRSLGHIS